MRELMALVALLLVTACTSPPAVVQTTVSEGRPPIVDMHLHAYRLADGTAPPENLRSSGIPWPLPSLIPITLSTSIGS